MPEYVIHFKTEDAGELLLDETGETTHDLVRLAREKIEALYVGAVPHDYEVVVSGVTHIFLKGREPNEEISNG
jgi:hypothetical protein